MRSTSGLAAIAAAAALLSGCGGGQEPTATSTRPAITAAVASWRAADTGHFEQVTRYSSSASGPRLVTRGEYQLSGRRARYSVEYIGLGTNDARLDVIGISGVAYMNAPAWPLAVRRCWLVVDQAALQQVAGSGVATSVNPFPPNLQAVSGAKPSRLGMGGDSIAATVDLRAAATMFLGSRFLDSLAGETLAGRLSASFTLDGAEIESLRVDGADLLTTLLLNGMAPAAELDHIAGWESTVTYSELGEPVDIQAPPGELRMTYADFEADRCD